VAMADVQLPEGATKEDLLEHLTIPDAERGYLFVNAVLCAVPGLGAPDGKPLQDGDHVGIFSIDRIWPYQYRDGVRMSEALQKALAEHGPMHHSY
jgi:hypothetical protein